MNILAISSAQQNAYTSPSFGMKLTVNKETSKAINKQLTEIYKDYTLFSKDKEVMAKMENEKRRFFCDAENNLIPPGDILKSLQSAFEKQTAKVKGEIELIHNLATGKFNAIYKNTTGEKWNCSDPVGITELLPDKLLDNGKPFESSINLILDRFLDMSVKHGYDYNQGNPFYSLIYKKSA